ncbi:cytochrome b [Rhizobium sp. ARZ01]|uniref:cytochrome b n=1 Tax=Rhizobium sp. ARZ01 TaxID=2769313 RepID=UPI00177BE2FF|nr:cytochrome b [Rhizobium sp. ARZ01]MBD9371468.1 cytochrome b [Rhizobium sp. ARZ01]
MRQGSGYGALAIALHWLIALMILGLVGLGFVMRRMAIDPALQFSLYQWHKSIGIAALGLACLRAALWLFTRHPPPVPSLSPIERKASHATHVALALLSLAVPVAGWAVASTSTLNIPTFFFNLVVIPSLPLARSGAAEDFWTLVHASAAYVLLGLAVFHAAAALYHHFVRRDEVLLRMLGRSPQVLPDPVRPDSGPTPTGPSTGTSEGSKR